MAVSPARDGTASTPRVDTDAGAGAPGRPAAGPWEFVYFGAVDWNYTWQRPQQLATRLARFGRLLYVNPLGLRPPRAADLGRLVGRLRAGSRNPAGPGVSVGTVWFYLPFPGRAVADRLNAWRLCRLIRRWRARGRGAVPVLWVGTPTSAVLRTVELLGVPTLVYDCVDNVALLHRARARITATEARLAARARVVFATATTLCDRMRRINPATVWLPNGADYEHFARATDPGLPSPSDMVGIPRPVLGYMGEIAGWFDVELVETLAAHPAGWQIVLIGTVQTGAASRLLRHPNVHYLGRKAYADLPAYVRGFDVCLLPFRVDALTTAVNPVKLYEYLAAGKPVVSTPLPEVQRYVPVVTVAERQGFPAAVERALGEGAARVAVECRLAVARENSWDRRVADALAALRGLGPGG